MIHFTTEPVVPEKSIVCVVVPKGYHISQLQIRYREPSIAYPSGYDPLACGMGQDGEEHFKDSRTIPLWCSCLRCEQNIAAGSWVGNPSFPLRVALENVDSLSLLLHYFLLFCFVLHETTLAPTQQPNFSCQGQLKSYYPDRSSKQINKQTKQQQKLNNNKNTSKQ